MDREKFCIALQSLIDQGIYIGVTVTFDMGNGESYPRRMQVLDMKDGGEGYVCIIKGYGSAQIAYNANFVMVGP
jgi:hypothetical protein